MLAIRGLSRRFGHRVAIDHLDLDVGEGERVALRGANGSGKSTVLRCVAGTLEPTRGEVLVRGHHPRAGQARELVGASLAPERSFYLRLTGHANLLAFAGMRNMSRRAARREVVAIEEELSIAELAAISVAECSTGMVQQLAFARALLGGPALLVLDEPTRSLDAAAIDRLWSAIDRRPALSLLLATHRQEDVDRCDRCTTLPQ